MSRRRAVFVSVLCVLLAMSASAAWASRPRSDIDHLRSWAGELGDDCGRTAVEPATGDLLYGAQTGRFLECDPDGDGGVITVLDFKTRAARLDALENSKLEAANRCVDGRTLLVDGLQFGGTANRGADARSRATFKRWCGRFDGDYAAATAHQRAR